MATRKLTIDIIGNAGAKKAFDQTEREAAGFQGRMNSKLKGIGGSLSKAGAVATAGLTVPIVAALGKSTKAASEDQASQAQLAQALSKNGFGKATASVEDWISKTQDATGVLDDDLRPAFAKLVQAGRTPTQAMADLSTALDISAAKGKPVRAVAEAMAKAAQGNVGALGRMGVAVKGADGKTVSYDEALKKAAGTMGGAMAASSKTAEGRARILKARMGELSEQVGNVLLPFVRKAGEWVSKLAGKFQTLSPGVKKVIVVAVVLAAVLGPLLLVAGSLASAIAAIGLPVIAVVAGIALLVAGVIYAYKHFEGFRKVVDAVGRFLVDTVWPAIKRFVELAQAGFARLVQWVRDNWPQISEAIGHVLAVVKAIVGSFVSAVQRFWAIFGDAILSATKTAWEFVRGTIENAMTVISGVVKFVLAIINGDWGKAWDAIKQVLSGVWDQLKSIVSTGLGLIGAAISGALSFLSTVWTSAWDGLKSAATGIWDAVSNAAKTGFGKVVGWVLGGVNTVIRLINRVIRLYNKLPGKDLAEIPTFDVGAITGQGNSSGWSNNPDQPTNGRPGQLRSTANGAGRSIGTVNIYAKGTDARDVVRRLDAMIPAGTS